MWSRFQNGTYPSIKIHHIHLTAQSTTVGVECTAFGFTVEICDDVHGMFKHIVITLQIAAVGIILTKYNLSVCLAKQTEITLLVCLRISDIPLYLVVEIILYPVKARDFASSDNIPFIILYFKMNSCKEYSFNDIRFEALQVIHTLTETYFTFIISSSTIIKRLILIFVRKECLTLFYWK